MKPCAVGNTESVPTSFPGRECHSFDSHQVKCEIDNFEDEGEIVKPSSGQKKGPRIIRTTMDTAAHAVWISIIMETYKCDPNWSPYPSIEL